MTELALKVDEVSKTYPPAQQALKAVSFGVRDSEFVSIVGASGCGKTTLLRIIAGLQPSTSGQVLVHGRPVSGPSQRVGVAFQADRLLPWRSIRANVGIGLELRGVKRGVRDEKVDELLALVGLEDFSNQYPYQLSGGMRQRASLARALAISPDLMLLDEPFAALDAQTRELMQEELLRICDALGSTTVFVTHQIDEAVYLSDRVIVLSRRPGTIREILKIDLPRPRRLEVKRTQDFTDHVAKAWSLLEGDIYQAADEAS